jgi:predicted negative regulator of RcsB-dependent stress response
MDKITEKEIRQPDAFIQTIDRVNSKLQPNKKIIIGLVIAVLLAAAGWATWDLYNSRREAQAQEALFIASHQVDKKDQAIAEATAPKKDPTKNPPGKNSSNKNQSDKNQPDKNAAADSTADSLSGKPKNLDADYGVPLKSLQSVIDLYPGTRASWIAALEIARINQDYGQVDQGMQALQKIDVGNSASDLITATVQLRRGDFLQLKGQCDQAIAKWNLVTAAKGFDPLKPEALLRTGLCYENLKKYDEAKITYEKLTKDKESSESRAGREGKKFLKLLQSTRRSS